jgi:hypothetical protein
MRDTFRLHRPYGRRERAHTWLGNETTLPNEAIDAQCGVFTISMSTTAIIRWGFSWHALPPADALRGQSLAELHPVSNAPKTTTLNAWNQKRPEGIPCVLAAPEAATTTRHGALHMGPELMAKRAWFLEAATTLRATAIVWKTSRDLSPGARSVEQLAAFFSGMTSSSVTPTTPVEHVWCPSGLWDPAQALHISRQLGVSLAIHPPMLKELHAELAGMRYQHVRLVPVGLHARWNSRHLQNLFQTMLDAGNTRVDLVIEEPRRSAQGYWRRHMAECFADLDLDSPEPEAT